MTLFVTYIFIYLVIFKTMNIALFIVWFVLRHCKHLGKETRQKVKRLVTEELEGSRSDLIKVSASGIAAKQNKPVRLNQRTGRDSNVARLRRYRYISMLSFH
jgi:signal transduction histidine kinase